MNTKLQSDIELVKSLLPESYTVTENNSVKAILCKSKTGIRMLPFLTKDGRLIDDAEDEETWERFFKSIKIYFGSRFQEVYHNTCFCHVDFIIYLKA